MKEWRDVHRGKIELAGLQLEGLAHQPPLKSPYRKAREGDAETGPDLYYGKPCVVRISEAGSVVGYVLARIIDWRTKERWWSQQTMIYMIGEQASSPKTDNLIGRVLGGEYAPLVAGSYRRRAISFYRGDDIISFDPADMPPRRGP